MRSRFNRKKPIAHEGYQINREIRNEQLRLIDHLGENHGVVSRRDALLIAEEANMDLVVINKGAADSIPVAKIMDFGRFLYDRKKKQGEAKKRQTVIQIKEVKMRPNIGDGDYLIKMKKAIKFLEEGKKVKFTLQFRGRQMIMMNDLGSKLFARISKDLNEASLGTLLEEKETRSRPFWSKVVAVKSKH